MDAWTITALRASRPRSYAINRSAMLMRLGRPPSCDDFWIHPCTVRQCEDVRPTVLNTKIPYVWPNLWRAPIHNPLTNALKDFERWRKRHIERAIANRLTWTTPRTAQRLKTRKRVELSRFRPLVAPEADNRTRIRISLTQATAAISGPSFDLGHRQSLPPPSHSISRAIPISKANDGVPRETTTYRHPFRSPRLRGISYA